MGWRAALGAFAFGMCMAAPIEATEIDRVDSDLRCLAVSLTLLSSESAEQRQAGLGSFLYWLGRVDGGNPSIDLETRLRTLSTEMTQEQIASELVRCGQELVRRGQEVQAVGQRLEATGH